MPFDYMTVTPHKTRLITKHFTPGRGGAKVEFITRHHNAGITDTNGSWQTWQTREASAHYQIEPNGQVGQLVYDRDTAWANADTWANQRTIAIEHSNSGGANQDWPIDDVVIVAGAKWAAALCRFYKLGRPQYGKNIRDHKNFYATGCPYHLAGNHNGKAGKYHARWMQVAQQHYDLLVSGAHPNPTKPGGPVALTPEQDTKAQLTGSPKPGEYPGWTQLGGRTVVDALAAIGEKLGVDGMKAPKGGK